MRHPLAGARFHRLSRGKEVGVARCQLQLLHSGAGRYLYRGGSGPIEGHSRRDFEIGNNFTLQAVP